MKEKLNVYLLANRASDKSAEVHCAIILHTTGSDFIQKEEQIQYANDDDRKNPVKPLEKQEEYCNKNQNQITSTIIFYKTSSASLDCVSINDLRSAIDTTIGTLHDNFTSQHQIETLKFGRMQHVKFIA